MDSEALATPPHVAGPLRLEPFRAITLAPHRIGDAAAARIFARPHAAIPSRLSAGEANGTVRRDPVPGIYLHEFVEDGRTIRGLVGALDVTQRTDRVDLRVVHPHERVHTEQAQELAERMHRMQLNPAPILLVHRAGAELAALQAEICTRVPDHQFLDRADQRHRIWAIREREELAAINLALRGTTAILADGHHRFAAYLEMQRAHPGTPADFGLAMLVDHAETPLRLGAIHRILIDTPISRLAESATHNGWTAEDVGAIDQSTVEQLMNEDSVVLTDAAEAVRLVPPHAELIVTQLHRDLIPALPQPPPRIDYQHHLADVWPRLRASRDTAVLLPAPSYDSIVTAVRRGELLPEKATSFQPKPHVGVLFRSLDD